MKTLIIASGHLGSTVKAGRMLAEEVQGGAVVFDTLNEKKLPENMDSFDTFVFGTNMRMFALNARFKRYASKLKKYYKTKRVFAYLCCSGDAKAEAVCDKIAKKLGCPDTCVKYIGGSLDFDRAQGFAKQVLQSVTADFQKQGKPLPTLDHDRIAALGAAINSDTKS